MRARLLGAGTSSGVPRLGPNGPDWGDCDPANPKNYRTRASLLIESDAGNVLVDTSPDLRTQLLAADVPRIDAVVWTHEHADHCHGIDDLRQVFLAQGAPIPTYARPDCWKRLQARFAYAWQGNGGYPALLTGHAIAGPLQIKGMRIDAIDMPHGGITSTGYRFELAGKKIGYATDFQNFSHQMRHFFSGLDIFVIDALRRRPHPTHPHLQMTLDAIAATAPKQAVLMHMDSSMDYAQLAAELPDGIVPGYDNLVVTA